MVLYLSVILIGMLIITAVNALCGVAEWHYIAIAVVWCTALQFLFDAIVAVIVHLLPNDRFGVDNPHFEVSDRARALYRRLGVRKWKDKVWELGGLGGFSKKSLGDASSPEHIERFIIECNKGVVTHRASYPVGFLAMLTLPNLCAFTVALPVALVNLFLNILPVMILRENTPRLKMLLNRLKRKATAQ